MTNYPGTCLLLVEDDLLVRVTVAMMLEDEGFGVIEAGGAAEALSLLGNGLMPSVMVTDVDLGGGPSGTDLADSLKAKRPEMAIIFVTGRSAKLQGRRMGPREAMLPKPFAARTLSRMVREIMR